MFVLQNILYLVNSSSSSSGLPQKCVECSSGWSQVWLPALFLDGPKSSSVSVTGETVEGSPVTLSCSSDANPESDYTWFKDGNKVFEGQKYQFPNVRTKDSGSYHCKSENQHGSIESSPKVLNISSEQIWSYLSFDCRRKLEPVSVMLF